MVNDNHTPFNTNFTVSIEAATGVTTGISAADRARTIQVAVARDAKSTDIVQPGHVFPIMAQPGGVLRRAGHTESGCDLARLAGYLPAAVIVEIMNDDGTMARRPDLEQFARKHQLKMGTIVDLIHYRIANEHTVHKLATSTMQTRFGEFQVHQYQDSISGNLHLAFTKGNFSKTDPVLVRVHIPNTLRDVCEVFSPRTSWSFASALEKINLEGQGVIVLLSEADYGQSLAQSLHAHQQAALLADATGARQAAAAPDAEALQRPGNDLTIGTGSQILRDLGVGKMRLLSYPARFNAISGFDLEVVEFVPFQQPG